jgi:hypothetical protein
MNGHRIALVQYDFGIAWDHMGVNGMRPNKGSRSFKYS